MSTTSRQRPTRTPGMSAKEEILARLRTALAAPGQADPAQSEQTPRRYQRADDKQETTTDAAKIRDVLAQRLEEYRAQVLRTTPDGLAATIAQALSAAPSVIHPSGVPAWWLSEVSEGTELLTDDGTATARDLDATGAVLTGSHTAIALTGTVVLRADDLGGRRALTLLPDHHVVVVDAADIVLGVPRAIERMAEDPGAAWTLVSGPSATSDIELERVEGVHGPRRLDVILVEPA